MSNTMTAMMAGEEAGALTVLFHPCDEGGFTAECIELPGCFSEGETQEEAERNIRLAIDACLSVLFEDCLNKIRREVDLASIDLRNVSKQERFPVETPRLLQMPEYA